MARDMRYSARNTNMFDNLMMAMTMPMGMSEECTG
jgi:hypothetical protein